jgi:zinc-ribbon domain
MKTLDTRSATDEYMSTHSLTFSTPLKEFVIWLCEQVSTRDEKEQIPRIMLYLKDKEDRHGNIISSKPSPSYREPHDNPESKFCIECGSNIKTSSKFCTKCGTKQE